MDGIHSSAPPALIPRLKLTLSNNHKIRPSNVYQSSPSADGGVKYYEASAQSVTYKNVVYSYPLQRDSGVVLRMSNYSGTGSATYQSCMTIQFKKYGQATYLAGLSTINGIDYYNEEGAWLIVCRVRPSFEYLDQNELVKSRIPPL